MLPLQPFQTARHAAMLTGLLLAMSPALAAAQSAATAPFDGHPAAATFAALFPGARPASPTSGFQPTHVSKTEYLALVAATVDFYRQHQRDTGTIADPYTKREEQYATPTFASAAAVLVKEGKRPDLLAPATIALTWSIDALCKKGSPPSHSDFYMPFVMRAWSDLREAAPPALRSDWERKLRDIVPELTYHQNMRGMKWDIVSASGELLRRQAGLVPDAYAPSQWNYLEECFERHLAGFTPLGMLVYDKAPVPQDGFARAWFDGVMATGAYRGAIARPLQKSLVNGALTGLLLLSPTGEAPTGGRSAFQVLNDAQVVLTCEIHANYWKNAGRPDIAGAFKRAAHLAFGSVQRWQRPAGDLWLIKNRADPARRMGYEDYSFDSPVTLYAVSMLAWAAQFADDTIEEAPTPAETGGYVLDLRDTFHKVSAAAAGYSVLFDTAADPEYNATGLQRVHRAGVAFSALSDTTAGKRSYEPKNAPPLAISPGLSWRDPASAGTWLSLADFTGGQAQRTVKSVVLTPGESSRERVTFTLDYTLDDGGNTRSLVEQYAISSEGVDCTTELRAPPPGTTYRAHFPILVNDGASDTQVGKSPGKLTITHNSSILTITTGLTGGPAPELITPRTVMHSGWVERAVIPMTGTTLWYRISLSTQ